MGDASYERFTGPARLDRDMHMLEGFLQGVSIDGHVNPDEAAALLRWCVEHEWVATLSPFDEVLPKVRAAVTDGVMDEEEKDDLLWLCRRTRTPNAYYSVATGDMQRLHGLLLGIAADGRITEAELRSVQTWLETVESLRGTWPYDEIDALITGILADGRIDEQEHRVLMRFCQEFRQVAPSLVLDAPFDEDLIRFGVCAASPEIDFAGRRFCFTGNSPAGQRRHLERVVSDLGGTHHPRVRQDLDYLIIGAEGNRCWAFSCYGRKVEAAIALRKEGARLTIAHESDFWDAAADRGVDRSRYRS